jgi:inner membrane protein involved in colicin E2 resistance
MIKRIVALTFIFICTSIAWMILGGITNFRTYNQDGKLKKVVSQLWGTVQQQQAPLLFQQIKKEAMVKTTNEGKTTEEAEIRTENYPLILGGSDIDVRLKLDQRKKGLLWYSVYRVEFTGKYKLKNSSGEKRDYFFEYAFPTSDGVYDNFSFKIDGARIEDLRPAGGKISELIPLGPNEEKEITITYESQGMDEWWYVFGKDVSQTKNFALSMETDFDKIDFPENSISPVEKSRTPGGWKLKWQYSNLLSGIQIGMKMPQKLNPGPFVSKVTFFAPVSLFLFMFLMFIITAVRKVNIHPMNFFFIACAFFSFHLLMAYLADIVDIAIAFAISSAVSIFLVISYMRIVAGIKFALIETGISQLVYLVLFSYAFFLEGYTGLAITTCCIITLFVVMQVTAKIDWEKQFKGGDDR